jgi:hypothetical protein
MSVIIEHRNFLDLREQPLVNFRNIRPRKRLGLAERGIARERSGEERDKRGTAKRPTP